jgi:signal transduction histidine kinase/ligand-binding sensor domain-containing protein
MRGFTTSISISVLIAGRPFRQQAAGADHKAGQGMAWQRAAWTIARRAFFVIDCLAASIAHEITRPLSGIIFFFISVFCVPQPAFSVERTIQQYVHTAWGDKEGAPSGILALAQTSDGYLWIGTIDGLYRFDGVSFELYRTGVAYALFSGRNGDLWIGGNGSISVLSDGKEKTYAARDGVPNGKVAGFAADSDGTIWVATNIGLARFEGDRWIQVGQDWNFPGKLATGMCLDRNGTFWVATENTIVFLPRGSRKFQRTGISSGEVWEIVEAPNGKLWLAETTRSVRPMPLGNNLRPSDKAEIVAGSIGILFDREGSLWVSTIGSGVRRVPHPEELEGHRYEVPSEKVETFTSKEGLTNELVTTILEDREGNIWVGTNNGLDCFRKGKLVPVVSPFPLLQPLLSARDEGRMSIFSDDRMIETEGAGQYRTARIPDLNLYAYRDPKGVVWWSGNGFASRVEDGHIVRIPPKTAKQPFRLFPRLTEDFNGVVWGDVQYEGIFYLKGDVWQRMETPPEIAKLDPSAEFTDWMGRIWFGFDNGGALVTLEKNVLRVVAASGQSPVGKVITSIQGRGHHVWIGGAKLVYFDGSSFHEVVPFDGDAFKVYGIEETSDGSLWLCESRGVVHIPSAEVQKFLSNYSSRVQYDLYDSADGLPGSFRDASARSREVEGTDGRLWFAATKGVAWLDPAMISRNPIPPPVAIRFVDADGKQYRPGRDLALPPRLANLKITYTALSLSIPSRVRFRYKLEGIDPDWQEPGTRREAFYTRLAPGKYRFRVIACNNDGVWNETGASLDFSILPAYYQTGWFRALCGAAFLLLLWVLYQFRLRRLQHQFNIGLEAQVNERTRIARELHDTLLQTFHGLMFQFQAGRNLIPRRPEEAMRSLDEAIHETEKALAESRDAIKGLRSEPIAKGDLAELLRATSQQLAASGIENQDLAKQNPPVFDLIEEGERRALSAASKNEICRIGFEILRNAYRHSQAQRIEAEIRYDVHMLRLRIRDDGRGIDPTVLKDGGKAGHWGLRGLRERAERIGAKLDFWSEAAAGTEVQLAVPAAVAYESLPDSVASKLFRRVRNRGQH